MIQILNSTVAEGTTLREKAADSGTFQICVRVLELRLCRNLAHLGSQLLGMGAWP